jgi:ubiquinone/menaquinone biosynthesis C-methylase UbiE
MKFTGEQVVPADISNRYLYLEHQARYMYAAQFVRGQSVLDLGCGTGYGSVYLALQGARQVVGIDINAEAINYADYHYQEHNLAYIRGNCLSVGFKNHSFDIIISFEVIEHIEKWQNYLEEVARLLKPGGYFIGSTPNKRLHSPDIEKSHNPFHVREYLFADLQQILSTYFINVRILGQSPLQGFLISEYQSLACLAQNDRLRDNSALVMEKGSSDKQVEKAKDFVFICQKQEETQSVKNSIKIELYSQQQGQVYLSEPIAVEYMRAIQIIKSQEKELSRLNNQLLQLHSRLIQFENGRFIKFMAWLHQLRQKFANKPLSKGF